MGESKEERNREVTQIRLSGFGGQGIVLAGILLGEAGVIDGKYVAGSNSYGAQARGSACKAEIVFSNGPIDFPHVVIADILVAMSQGAYDLFSKDVRESVGLILYDQGLVRAKEGLNLKQIGIPATEWALEELKNKQAANIVLLGALVGISGVVSQEAAKKAIDIHVNVRFRDLNHRAFQGGVVLGRQRNG